MILQIQIYIKLVKVQLNSRFLMRIQLPNSNGTTRMNLKYKTIIQVASLLCMVFKDIKNHIECWIIYSVSGTYSYHFSYHALVNQPINITQHQLENFYLIQQAPINASHQLSGSTFSILRIYNHIQYTFPMHQQIYYYIIKLYHKTQKYDIPTWRNSSKIISSNFPAPVENSAPEHANLPTSGLQPALTEPLTLPTMTSKFRIFSSSRCSKIELPWFVKCRSFQYGYPASMQVPCLLCYSDLVVIGNGNIQQFRGFAFWNQYYCRVAQIHQGNCWRIAQFHRSRVAYNHKFKPSEDFEAVSFKAYSLETIRRSLLGIQYVCCWKWNNRIWDIRNRQETQQGAGRMEVGFISCDCAFYIG
ncbi:hypothetical protein SS50377_21577 [Spironucleus salmonicida]|uniref:Uncharacterized protein n=1 Tax=Spironucleus salmonicida TaxID=348837 RepID=A0A9P8S0S8_9EUKA|nr:hypothetical protein SS50377_21577 [Spironucleus salmonicida]